MNRGGITARAVAGPTHDRMRSRDLNRLAATAYDVLVVGGGIHGLACAYDAASRGLRTALVEAADFGGAASFNHQKTAHGGLRSLQSLSFRRAREAVVERRALARIAPWLLRPLPFLVPTYRSWTRSRTALRAAFALDGWIGRDRNEGLEPELHLPAARLLSRTATAKLFPGVRQAGLTGGAQWYDYQMVENDRLTFAFAAAADRAGADLANYARARAIARRDGLFVVTVADEHGGSDVDVRTRALVNAAGARSGDVMAMFGVRRPFPLVKAINLVTTRPAADIALAAADASGRMLTLVPWRGRAIVGTGQRAQASTPADDRVARDEIARFIDDVNVAFPALRLTEPDVALVHRGLVPGTRRGNGTVDLLAASRILDHARDGSPGALTVVGAKYTTARGVAERAVALAARAVGTRPAPSRTGATPLPGAGIRDHEALAIEAARRLEVELPPDVIAHLTGRYAEAAAAIVGLVAERPGLAEPLAPGCVAIGAEVVHAIRNEAALRLTDIILRRTTLGAAGHPGAAVLARAADLAAAELGWDALVARQQIAEVEKAYAV